MKFFRNINQIMENLKINWTVSETFECFESWKVISIALCYQYKSLFLSFHKQCLFFSPGHIRLSSSPCIETKLNTRHFAPSYYFISRETAIKITQNLISCPSNLICQAIWVKICAINENLAVKNIMLKIPSLVE